MAITPLSPLFFPRSASPVTLTIAATSDLRFEVDPLPKPPPSITLPPPVIEEMPHGQLSRLGGLTLMRLHSNLPKIREALESLRRNVVPVDLLLLGGHLFTGEVPYQEIVEEAHVRILLTIHPAGPVWKNLQSCGVQMVVLSPDSGDHLSLLFDSRGQTVQVQIPPLRGRSAPQDFEPIPLMKPKRIEEAIKAKVGPRVLGFLARRLGAEDRAERALGTALPIAAHYLTFLEQNPDSSREDRLDKELSLMGRYREIDDQRKEDLRMAFAAFLREWGAL